MLSSMIDEVRRAEAEAEAVTAAAKDEAAKLRAEAEAKAAEMTLEARERAVKRTKNVLSKQMQEEEAADREAADETEKKAERLRGRAAEYSDALGEKLREIMFA
ncbi:MAG: hypothetical protein Q4G33_08535 [bacterium]|nr:hypothetical protein [bacterium]